MDILNLLQGYAHKTGNFELAWKEEAKQVIVENDSQVLIHHIRRMMHIIRTLKR